VELGAERVPDVVVVALEPVLAIRPDVVETEPQAVGDPLARGQADVDVVVAERVVGDELVAVEIEGGPVGEAAGGLFEGEPQQGGS
jgi:hypothetical protein